MSGAMRCQHVRRALVWCNITRNGTPSMNRTLRAQCQDCGLIGSKSLPYSRANHDTPEVEIARAQAGWEQDREADRQEYLGKLAESNARREQQNAEWWARYEEHLQSERWQQLRRLVFARCRHICEGCNVRRATEVHHLKYDHMGNEFLFELVGICEQCHDRFHYGDANDVQIGTSNSLRSSYRV